MISLLVAIYHFFQRRKLIFYCCFVLSVAMLAYFALKVKLQEDISRFLPNIDNSGNIAKVFKNIKATDKLILVFSAKDDAANQDTLVAVCDELTDELYAENKGSYIDEVLKEVNTAAMAEMTSYIYSNLPIFLTPEDYKRIDSLLTPEHIESRMKSSYTNLISPAGLAVGQYIMLDPLGIGFKSLERLKDLDLGASYELYNGHIFSEDGKYLLAFISPTHPNGNTKENAELVRRIKEKIANFQQKYPLVHVGYFGGPAISASNADQVKADTLLTSIIALAIIVVFISLAFRKKAAIPLIVMPVAFGGLFSLALIAITQGELSAIAVGAGSAILGIALSYTIHVMVHFTHTNSPVKVIREIAAPLTIGSITTIGAFLGLAFTNSEILSDFGLFSAYTLIGTTLFCLIFMPQFLRPAKEKKHSKLHSMVERANGYAFEKNRWIIIGIFIATILGWFASRNVEFESGLDDMYYKDPELFATAKQLDSIMGSEVKTVYFVSVANTVDSTYQSYSQAVGKLKQLDSEGLINGFSSAASLLIPPGTQQERIAMWNEYWTADKKQLLVDAITTEAAKLSFKKGAFSQFEELLNKTYSPINFNDPSLPSVFKEWVVETDNTCLLINQVQLKVSNRDVVYDQFKDDSSIVVFDTGYYTKQMIAFLNQDFNLVLFISSVLVFIALLISYGRIELASLAFAPMVISWIIILGLFSLLGIKLNIINIIISTFIFGIGDDFSIFVMDGLLMEYERGRKTLTSHKTAIFYSAFTILVGVGVLVFAKHPALFSVAISSFIGLVTVVFVVYTVQPFLFRLLVSSRVKKGLPPYTLKDLITTSYLFVIFLVGCLWLSLLSYLLPIVPVKKKAKMYAFRSMLVYCLRFLLWAAYFVKRDYKNIATETFKNPAVIIANHQSVVDILVMLSISPKVIMLTNKWVWKSPFFGRIVRYAGYYCVNDGYENATDVVQMAVNEGYSAVIFPEGTRSVDGTIKRFHKGAFFLANELKLDIVPVLLHGNNQAISKKDLFSVRSSNITRTIYPRIVHGDTQWGASYQEQCKLLNSWFRSEYEKVDSQKRTTDNRFFKMLLSKNFIYKGPVLEWYLRIKARMEGYYKQFDKLIPHDANVCDIGCGYGFMAYMLSFVSSKRRFTCIDYDKDKIELANHCFSKNEQLRFIAADASDFHFDRHDVFVLNDMLHYLSTDKQLSLLHSCAKAFSSNGMIIIRDGDKSDVKRHRLTWLTELFSTRILKFNKTKGSLHFINADFIANFANTYGLRMSTIENDAYTSNTIFVLTPIQSKEA